ncbi:hypothetical protein GCM10009753_47900 [Streptantibioticus ferralitis]
MALRPSARPRAAQGHAEAGGPLRGHDAPRDLVDDADPEVAGHESIAHATPVPQRDLEALPAEHAARLGVPVRHGVVVTGLHLPFAENRAPDPRPRGRAPGSGWRGSGIVATSGSTRPRR